MAKKQKKKQKTKEQKKIQKKYKKLLVMRTKKNVKIRSQNIMYL